MENTKAEILLVEDNPQDAEMTIRALRKSHVVNDIVHVTNGALALDFLFARGTYANRQIANLPRLILLDLKIPKLDGIEVLEKIKSSEVTRTIPVVVLTSSRENPDVKRCYQLGVNSYIVKPVEFESFSKAVTTAGIYWLLLNQLPE